MYCHSCGSKLVDGARFCSSCGTPVPKEVLNRPGQPAQQQIQPAVKVVNESATAQDELRKSPVNVDNTETNTIKKPDQELPEEKDTQLLYKFAQICFRLVDKGGKLDGYRFGGDDDGYVQIRTDRMIIYKRSKTKRITMGAISDLVDGHGKEFAVIYRSSIKSFTTTVDKKNNIKDYRLTLDDGRLLKIQYIGQNVELFHQVMKLFLS